MYKSLVFSFTQMCRVGFLERAHGRACDRARVHFRPRNQCQGGTGSDSRECLQDVRLPCDTQLREPLQPSAASQDCELLQGDIRRYVA